MAAESDAGRLVEQHTLDQLDGAAVRRRAPHLRHLIAGPAR